MVDLIKDEKNLKTLICLVTTYISFGLVYVTISMALTSFPPVILSFARYFTTGIIYLVWSYGIKRERTLPTGGDFKIIFIVALGMMVIKGGLLIYSEVYIPSGLVAVLIGTTPMWMVLFGWWFFHDKRPAPVTTVGLVAGFIGVVILAVQSLKEYGENEKILYGMIFITISILGGTLGSLYSKNRRMKISVVASFGYQMMFASAIFAAAAYLMGEFRDFSFALITVKSWVGFALMVILGSLAGFSAYLWLLYNAPSGVSTSYTYVEPIIAVMAGVLFGRERLTWALVAGCILIVFSVFIIIMRRDLWRRGPF